LTFLPGRYLSNLGPIFKKLRYPTNLSSSFPLPNSPRTFFTAGGGPAFFPSGLGFISNSPTRVELINSSADSKINLYGMLSILAFNHST
jgi:hypothetical protein